MYIKRFEKYNDVKLDTQYELRIIETGVDGEQEELEFTYLHGEKNNFDPFSLEDVVKLYKNYEEKFNPGELIIKQIVEKTVSKKTIDGIAQRLKYNL